MRKEAEQEVGALRADADRYAEDTRRDADAEGARVLADARKAADGERDAAERDASARRAEAEALYEDQRAKAAQAAADFETTLAERRQKATAEFQAQQAATQAELDAMAARNKDTEATLERNRAEAEERIARMLADAEERSTTMVSEARTSADRVRAESERELAAAAQRRDSINAQLSNVRQMLATLTGTVPGVVGLSDAPAPSATAPHGDPVADAAREESDAPETADGVDEQDDDAGRHAGRAPRSGEPGRIRRAETCLTHRSGGDTPRHARGAVSQATFRRSETRLTHRSGGVREHGSEVAPRPLVRRPRPGGQERAELVLEHRADAAAELLGLVGRIGLLGHDPVDDAAAVEVDRPHLLGPRHLGGVVEVAVHDRGGALGRQR